MTGAAPGDPRDPDDPLVHTRGRARRDLPAAAAAVIRLAEQRYRRAIAVPDATPEGARRNAARMAVATAVGRVVGSATTRDFATLWALVEDLRIGRFTGPEIGARHRGRHTRERAVFLADVVRDVARVLAASGVDLDDDGRTVTGLHDYADLLDPRPHVARIVLLPGALLFAGAECPCGWAELFPYAHVDKYERALRDADAAARHHDDHPEDPSGTIGAGKDTTS